MAAPDPKLRYRARMFALLSLIAPASACPTIATGTPNRLSFDTAVVAIVRQGERTTFTVAINPYGDPQTFALVLPVPEVLSEDEIHVLDPGVFASLDLYSAPRHVADAGCPSEGDADTDSDVDTDTDSDGDTGVNVEAEYIVGEYQIVILSSTESNALGAWLDANAYYLPEGAEPLLAEYIEAGSYFLAAKVVDGTSFTDGGALSPLQLAYDSAAFSIPIRLATLNSPGEQDMVIYAINDVADGRVGIANYPEFTVPDNCVWGAATADFGAFYEALYTEHWTAQGDAAWAAEFAGDVNSCNPCTGVYPSGSEIAALGFTGEWYEHFFTRIHFRYTPAQADQDPTLYLSGITTPHSQSYADDNPQNACIESWCDGRPYGLDGDTDTDADADTDTDSDSDTDTDTDTDADASDDAGCAGGCATGDGLGLAGLLFAAAAVTRRRR